MSTTADQVNEFVKACEAAGFSFSCKPGMVTIRRTFAPNDRSAFVACDMDAPSVLALAPTTGPGSQWGTDGGSVGGHVALTSGSFRMNQSGVSKRFTTALAKLA